MAKENLLSVAAIKRKYHLTAKVMSMLEHSLPESVVKPNPYYRSGEGGGNQESCDTYYCRQDDSSVCGAPL